MDAEDYADATEYWKTSLLAAGKSPATVKTYVAAADAYAAWCAARGADPDLSLRSVEAFTAGLIGDGKARATAVSRQLGVRRFAAWLAARDYIPADELTGMTAPRLEQRVVDDLSAAELAALLAACAGKRFVDIRDRAIIRFMAETGARSDELISMKTYDLHVGAGSCVIVRGKGGKGRRSGFGPKTGDALGRYLMARKKHPLAASDVLWLAERARVLSYDALYHELRRRAAAAGIEGFHPHRLRHTAAVRWLRAGGTVTGLMSQCGWSSAAMVQRYIEAASSELAIEESHRLRLGDI